eukprot:TRINITY_DN17078_c0_g1_i2.p1 TRINITY_DN17078_c0_g1~~TRINITY_DN17078_c0_g1_i2.p1  ORF type:complete len:119 (-),score=2.52 TRINITY_DN17078_c0_g1_i2:292-648(-)
MNSSWVDDYRAEVHDSTLFLRAQDLRKNKTEDYIGKQLDDPGLGGYKVQRLSVTVEGRAFEVDVGLFQKELLTMNTLVTPLRLLTSCGVRFGTRTIRVTWIGYKKRLGSSKNTSKGHY